MAKNRIIYIVFSLLIISGCSDDFVDVDPPFENSEEYFNSEEDYQDALIGAYDLLQATFRSAQIGEIASNNTRSGGGSALDSPGMHEIDDMIHTPVNQQLRDLWQWLYAGVNRANYILEFQDKTDFVGKDKVIAQARFLRAYYNFELVKFFGDIPFAINKRIKFGEQFSIPRSPKAEVYQLIEEDLIYAADKLNYTESQIGRVTKGAAQGLLGKVYLYQSAPGSGIDKFQAAATVLEDLINMGPYDLVQDYSTLFENDNENNIESVFEIQYTDEEGASFDCFQCSEGNIAIGYNGPKNYSGPVFDGGFAFNVPTQDVVDEFEPGDMRLETAILDIVVWVEETGATFTEQYRHTGYFNRKYIARKGDSGIGDPNLTNPNNYRAIRFADVLLMAAEALSRGNISDDRAKIYLNRVIERAFGNSDNNVNASGAGLTAAIYKERRVELVGEGHHFFDLVRTGRAASQIFGFQTDKNEVFPIPSIEIALAGNQWDQNSGY
jgi:hypothetical protein